MSQRPPRIKECELCRAEYRTEVVHHLQLALAALEAKKREREEAAVRRMSFEAKWRGRCAYIGAAALVLALIGISLLWMRSAGVV